MYFLQIYITKALIMVCNTKNSDTILHSHEYPLDLLSWLVVEFVIESSYMVG